MFNRFMHRKKRKLFNSKGFSSIVGAIFAVLIMFSLISAVFVWSLSQNSLYNNAMAQNRQLDVDRSNEKLIADVTCLSAGANYVAINGTLENGGSLPVQIVTAWATNLNAKTYGSNSPLNIALKPGSKTILVSGMNATLIELNNSPGDRLGCWFITQRGNTVYAKSYYTTIVNNNNGTASGNATWSLISQGIGAFAFDFTSFRYYNVTAGSPDRLNYSSGIGSYTVPYGGYVAFSFNLTNMYPSAQSITIYGNSEMWSYFPAAPGQATGPVWFPVNVNIETGIINATYTPITLPFNATTRVFFAHQSSNPDWSTLQKNQLGAVNLLMYGVFSSSAVQYAQNIPFVAIFAKY